MLKLRALNKMLQASFNFVRTRPSPLKKVHSARIPRTKTSDHDLAVIWARLISEYFPERLDLLNYLVVWSARSQKRVLGSCSLTKRKVCVARELRYAAHECWLEPLLYHELCHAVLGIDIRGKGGKRAWHGKEFRALEMRHPHSANLNAWMKAGGWRKAVRSDRAKRARLS